MSSDNLWTAPPVVRRDVLKSMTAAGIAAGLSSFPALAQEKPSPNQPTLAETLAVAPGGAGRDRSGAQAAAGGQRPLSRKSCTWIPRPFPRFPPHGHRS